MITQAIIMAYQFDDIQQALIKIMPVTPLRPLSWDDKLDDNSVDSRNTFNLGEYINQYDNNQFYQLCKTKMTPEEYLTRWSWEEDEETNFYRAEPDSTKYQIFLRFKINCDQLILSSAYSKQATWDAIVYGKLYQNPELVYDGIIALNHDLMKHIFQYIPDKIHKHFDDEIHYAVKHNNVMRCYQPEQTQLMLDRWAALYSE